MDLKEVSKEIRNLIKEINLGTKLLISELEKYLNDPRIPQKPLVEKTTEFENYVSSLTLFVLTILEALDNYIYTKKLKYLREAIILMDLAKYPIAIKPEIINVEVLGENHNIIDVSIAENFVNWIKKKPFEPELKVQSQKIYERIEILTTTLAKYSVLLIDEFWKEEER